MKTNKKRNTVNYYHYGFHSHRLNQLCIINRNNQKQYGVSNLTHNFEDGGGVSLSLARCESDTKFLPFFKV